MMIPTKFKVETKMKNTLVIFSIFTALFLAVGSASRVHAQVDQVVGGYGDISAKSNDARRAADFAVRARSAKTGKAITIVRIIKAEQQVVAGMNYRICMTLREGRRKAYAVTVVVYQNLRNRKSLSNWKRGGCSNL